MAARPWLLTAALLLPIGTALAAPQDDALALLRAGKRAEALHAFEAIIAAHPPDPSASLFFAASIDLEDGNPRTGLPLAERLVKLRPSSYPSWELMVQLYQAVDDRPARDAAIESLYTAWRSAIDPSVRARVSFIRDRIAGPRHTLLGLQTLEPGGDDILRFLFQPVEPDGDGHHTIVVRSDSETNERWRDNGTVSYDTLVYHLDTVETLPTGQTRAVPYEFYTEAPDYDRVREKVAAILAGTAQPLSGETDPFWAGEPGK